MKKTIIIALLALVATIAQAQRFEWAKGYDVYNQDRRIVGGVTDSLGNLYILGACDVFSDWEGEDLIPSIGKSSKDLAIDVVIAKISKDGELVWKKVVFSNNGGVAFPNDIKKLGDTAFACVIEFIPPSSSNYTYYLDTLLFGNSDYPIDCSGMGAYMWTAYLVFDFDGNVIEQHYLTISYTDADGQDLVYESNSWLYATYFQDASFDIDANGNIYICRRTQDQFNKNSVLYSTDNDSIRGLKFWVDRRLTGEYQITNHHKLAEPQLMKFSPHFDTLLACKYILNGYDARYYNPYGSRIKLDSVGNVYFMCNLVTSQDASTVIIDSLLNISFSHPGETSELGFLVKFDNELNAKWVIAFEDSITETALEGAQAVTIWGDFDIDQDSNLLFVFAFTINSGYRDTVNIYSGMSYQGVPLNMKSHAFFCAFDNNDTNPTLRTYNNVPEKYRDGPNVRGMCRNNRIIMQNQYGGGIRFPSQSVNLNKDDEGVAMTIFDYSGRVIGGYDYGIVTRNKSHYAGPIIQHDSILYLCSMLQSNARFGDIDFYSSDYTNCIAKYVDTALMHPYVWNPAGIGAAQAVQPKVYPVLATDMLHFVVPSGTATKATAISVLGNKTPLPTKGNSADVSALAPGTYILEISNGKAKYYSKFIKQ